MGRLRIPPLRASSAQAQQTPTVLLHTKAQRNPRARAHGDAGGVHDSKFQGFNITGRLQDYCKAHPKGNPKITGTIKVIEHTKINNASLESKLKMMLNVGAL